MTTRRIIEALKRRIKRGLEVLGLYLLWQTTGWTLMIFFLAILVGSAVKSIMAMPLANVGPFDPLLMPFRMLHWHTTRFLIEHPTAWTVWQHLPGYDPTNPFTLLTPTWGGVVLVGLAGRYLPHKKVKETPLASSITVHGDIGMMNTGTMAIRHIESIAAHLNRMASPTERRVVDAIAEVTKVVTTDATLDAATRAEVLDLLIALAQQTASPAADRSRGVGRTIVRTLDSTLSRAGNVADIWSAWGPSIKAFFGFSG